MQEKLEKILQRKDEFFANCFVQIMKRIGGNFELFEILVQLILKTISFL